MALEQPICHEWGRMSEDISEPGFWNVELVLRPPRRRGGEEWLTLGGATHPPSDCSLRRGSPGEPRAPAAAERKLGGSISAESGVTPRRSFSLNIFRQDGERLKDLALSYVHGPIIQ